MTTPPGWIYRVNPKQHLEKLKRGHWKNNITILWNKPINDLGLSKSFGLHSSSRLVVMMIKIQMGKVGGQIDQPVLRRGGHWMDKIRERQKKMMWMAISQRNEKQHYSRFLLEAVPLDVEWRIFWGYSDDPSDLRPIHAQKTSSIILSQRNKSWVS